ncbi:MAG: Gfo/Idh/MocA family oxidoreductase [Mariniphaga sp.]|nr:Gfo/Idh/MocA family oxidoreductase [Mariniphaga sp.]
MSDIRLGIIGAGNIAMEHLKVIQALDGVSVVGLTSRTISKAKEITKSFQVENVYENIESLIKKCSLDALMILVSANQIYDVIKDLIPNQIPLFIEKPPGLLPEQTKTLVELANQYETKTMVGYNRRYYSIFHKGLDIINKNGGLLGISIEGHERFWKIVTRGIPIEIRENWIYGNSTHTIDLLRFFGGNIRNINSFSKSLKEKNGDQFVAALEFESGALGSYSSYWYSPGGWSVTLYGEGVTVIFKPLEEGKWLDIDFKQYDIEPNEFDKKYKPGFYGQLKAFRNMLKTGTLDWPGQDLVGAFTTMELARKLVNA